MSNKIIYITGCCGFIGSYVTEACLNMGWYVIGVDKLTYASHPDKVEHFKEVGKEKFKFIHSDINDLNFLYDCDYIINTAAETHVDNSIVKSDDFIRSNINGVHNLLKLIKEKNIFSLPVLIHFSTDEVYGDIISGSHTEEDLLRPSNPYSATKAAADMLIIAWHRTHKIPYIIVRPTNNYGCGQYPEKLIPRICKSLLLGKKIPVHNEGKPKRMWLHAKDTAAAIIQIIQTDQLNTIFNISGNYETENIEIIKKVITSYFNKEINVNDYCDFTYFRKGQDVRYSIDDTKLRNIGWENKCVFDNELTEIVNYYKNNFIW